MLQSVLDVIAAHLTEPTGRGIANAVSDAIGTGQLREGDRLPPIREVALGLGVSPTTVSAAWALLSRAGSIRTDGRRGTSVAALTRVGPARYRQVREARTRFDLDLSSGVPDPELLPDLAPSLNRLRHSPHPTDYLDEPMLPELAGVVAADWPYAAERFTVADGAMDAIDQICTVLLRFGDRVAVEQPAFPPLLDLLEALGMRLVPVPFDEQGPSPQALRAAVDSGASAFFLQARAHNPSGISMTAGRARTLAEIVATSEAIVVEDDSAGMIASSPAHSLGEWVPGQVLHVRSYSKSHGPDLRLAALSGPATYLDALIERRYLGQGWTSRLLQRLLLDLLTSPSAQAEVTKAREAYAARRAAVVGALAAHGVSVTGTDGLNIWLPVRDESAALVRLASVGIGAAAGAPFAITGEQPGHLRITTALVRADHAALAAQLADAALLGPLSGRR
jgi:DNA-binding transcriptional MocR family regulator